MWSCGCFMKPKESNWGVIDKMAIFWVFSGYNIAIWPPLVVILSKTSYFLWIHFDMTNMLGVLGSRYGQLTPCGGHIERASYCLWLHFEEMLQCFDECAMLWLLCIIELFKFGIHKQKANISGLFCPKWWNLTPRVVIFLYATYCLVTYFNKI